MVGRGVGRMAADRARAKLRRMAPDTDLDEGPLGVLVAGAGVAGLETMVALRGLAPEAVAPTLVAPEEAFALRALTVYEAAGHEPIRRFPIAALARTLDVGYRRDAIAAVNRARRQVRLRSGATVPYDVLVVAVGGITYPAFDHGTLFDPPRTADTVARLFADVRAGRVRSAAVVVPPRSPWPLPAYELALMLHAAAPRRIAVTLVTPERAPLDLFGPAVTEMIRAEFTEAGIALLCGTSAQVPSARIVETGHGQRLRVDRILHLPGVAGPRIAGLPCDADGFIPVGADLHVDDDPDVLAIGDGAVGAYKHGGLAALQADAVAQELAARAGALLAPQPYRPALQAVLATNDGPRYLRAEPPGGAGESVVSAECLWWPPTKVASHWLAPWLATLDPAPADDQTPSG